MKMEKLPSSFQIIIKLKLILKRKYPLHKRMNDYLKNMIESRFKASNDKDFKDVIVLGTLNEKPEPYLRSITNTISNKQYKYIRYVSSPKDSGRCNLAIFNIFNKAGKTRGKIIGSKESYKGYGAEKEKAFDSNPASFDAKEEDWGKAWIGLELISPSQIPKLILCHGMIPIPFLKDKNTSFFIGTKAGMEWVKKWPTLLKNYF